MLAEKTVHASMNAVDRIAEYARRDGFEFFATADHGHITTDKAGMVSVKKNHPIFSRVRMWGSPRMRFAESANGEEVEDLLTSEFGRVSAIIKSDEAIASGMFGEGEGNGTARMNFGSYILIPNKKGGIYIEGEGLPPHPSEHGGFETAEIKVPFISCRRA